MARFNRAYNSSYNAPFSDHWLWDPREGGQSYDQQSRSFKELYKQNRDGGDYSNSKGQSRNGVTRAPDLSQWTDYTMDDRGGGPRENTYDDLFVGYDLQGSKRMANSLGADPEMAHRNSPTSKENGNVGDNSGSPSQGIMRLFSKYADRCSLNGVPFIKASKNPLIKAVWAILLFAAIAAMTYHLFNIFKAFYAYKKQSKVTLTFSNLQFPAVTICNVNALRKSRLSDASPDVQSLVDAVQPDKMRELVNKWDPGYEDDDDDIFQDDRKRKKRETNKIRISNFFDDFNIDVNFTDHQAEPDELNDVALSRRPADYTNSWEAESQPSSFNKVQEDFQTAFSLQTAKKRARLGHQIRDMLIQCSFNGGKCFQRNFTHLFSTNYGNCYTLEYSKFISRSSGPTAGLELILFLETFEYIAGITNGKGIQLVIHDQNTMPFPDDEGIAVQAGTQTFLGLRMVEIERLGDPYGDCIDAVSFQETYGMKYTRQTCQKFCEEENVRRACKCYNPLNVNINSKMPNDKNYPPCKTQDQSNCLHTTQWLFHSENKSCGCYDPCKEKKYSKTISSRQWPDTSFTNLMTDAVCKDNPDVCDQLREMTGTEELRQQFLKLSIFYEDLNYQNFMEEADYEESQFLSDIGGTIGLWIGLSLLSLCEIIHLFFDIATYVCFGRWKKQDRPANKYASN